MQQGTLNRVESLLLYGFFSEILYFIYLKSAVSRIVAFSKQKYIEY